MKFPFIFVKRDQYLPFTILKLIIYITNSREELQPNKFYITSLA